VLVHRLLDKDGNELRGGRPRQCQSRRTLALPGEDRRLLKRCSSLDWTMDDHRLSKRVKQTATNVPVVYTSKLEHLSRVFPASVVPAMRHVANLQ
jgi:hypothetical protein